MQSKATFIMHLHDNMLDFHTSESGCSNQEMVLAQMLFSFASHWLQMVLAQMLFSFASHWLQPESITGVCILCLVH